MSSESLTTSGTDSYSKQNDFDLLKLDVVSNQGGDPISMLNQFVEITIYEDIRANSLVGEVVLADAFNYAETIPLVGNEKITIEYRTRGKKVEVIKLEGRVFTILGKNRTSGEKAEVYKLVFRSQGSFIDHTKRVSSSLKGTISSMVSKVFADYMKDVPIFVDPTVGQYAYTIPFWSPKSTASWLARRAVASSSPDNPSCFVFYEDVDGFHFKDMTKKIRKDSNYTFRVEPPSGKNITDLSNYLTRVQEFNLDKFFDRLEEYNSGVHSGILAVHDLTSKRMIVNTLDYNQDFRNYKRLNENPIFPSTNNEFAGAKAGFYNVLPTQTKRYDSVEKPEDYEKYFLKRRSIVSQLFSHTASATVPGNSSLRLLDTVTFEVPKMGYMSADETNWKDIYLSGKYLITAMKHVINRQTGFTTTMELSKDSLIEPIPDKFK
jgi:hypothetical protein